MITKCCKDCKIVKDISEFSKGRRACKLCRRITSNKDYHARNKEYRKKYSWALRSPESKEKKREKDRIRREQRTLYLNNIKSSGCSICEEKNIVCIDFHHTTDDKEFELSKTSNLTPRLVEEIKKCILLCANCHRKHHAGQLDISSVPNLQPDELTDYFAASP